MTKPGYLRKRLLLLFKSDDTIEKQRIVDNYNKLRTNECYCGHTITCDCSNPGIYEFEVSLMNDLIPEEMLDKILKL